VDLADVAPFVAVLLGGTPCSSCAGDTGGGTAPGSPPDGLVDGRDVQSFVDCLLTGDCPTTGVVDCTPGDLSGPGGTPDGVVDLADVAPLVAVLLTGPANADELCRADLGGPAGGPPDGIADGHDIQPLVDCLVHGDCPRRGGPTLIDNTFYLHGSIVDALDPDASATPRLQLQYNRARYYDLRHGRWLQRDPTGYTDGGNLYEAFGGNPGRFADPMGLWIAERLAELLKLKGGITIGDIMALGEEMHADPAKQIGNLTESETELLRLLGGAEYGSAFTEETLNAGLKGEANRRFAGLAEPYRYRAMATLATRRRLLWALAFNAPSFADYVTDTYRLWRDVNPVTFFGERGYEIASGEEGLTGQRVSRVGAAAEAVVYVALGYAAKTLPAAVTGALGGEVPGALSLGPGGPTGASSGSGARIPTRAPVGNRSAEPMSLEGGPGSIGTSEAGGQLCFPWAKSRNAFDLSTAGRTGRQARLRELVDDTNVSSGDRGWIRQELNSIARGKRTYIRVPPGKNLAHRRGYRAKEGFSYEYSDLQDIDLHLLQHKYEGY
jgi:RHS repeat-associated protein